MFTGKMVTPAIPERLYVLCKIIEKSSMTNKQLRDKMEPEFLENNTEYYSEYKNAAEELGLITVSDNLVSLAVDPSMETLKILEKVIFIMLPKLTLIWVKIS